MESAVEAMESVEMALGALPRPGRVPEQRLLSPETHRWQRRSCGTLSRKTSNDLGFRLQRVLNRRRCGVRGRPGDPHHPLARPRGAPPPGVVGPRPPSGSPSFFVLRPGKIGGSGFVPSNSENISCVTFVKHKNSRKQELSLWHLVSSLVLENA
jgi:hypothetical protein